MKKYVPVILILLCIAQHCEAVSKIEKLLIKNPSMVRLVGLGICLSIGAVIFAMNYVSARREIMRVLRTVSRDRKKRKLIEREMGKRLRGFKKIPKDPIGDVSLPPAKLVCLHSRDNERGEVFEISPVRELTIGRSLENLFVVNRPSTSREHAKIRPQKEGYVLYDLLSRMGTFVNSQMITSRVLKDGDVIAIGKEEFLFKLGEKPQKNNIS
jgi:hypothetical protein